MSTLAAPARNDGTLAAPCAAAWRVTTAARRIVNTTSERRFMARIVARCYSLDQQTLRLGAVPRHLEIAHHRGGIGLVRVRLPRRARELGDPGAVVGTVELGVIGHGTVAPAASATSVIFRWLSR